MGVSKTYAAIRADTRLTPAEQEAKIQRIRDASSARQRELRAELRALRDADPNSAVSQRVAARKAAKVARREARRERKNARQRAKRAEQKARGEQHAERAEQDAARAEREAREAVPISTADPRLAARVDTPEEIAARAARNAARVARQRVDLLSVKPPKGPEEHAMANVLATVRRLGQHRETVRGRLAEIKSELGLGRIGAGDARVERERLEQLERDLTARLELAREAAGLPREIRAELGVTDSSAQSAQRTAARAARRARQAARHCETSGLTTGDKRIDRDKSNRGA